MDAQAKHSQDSGKKYLKHKQRKQSLALMKFLFKIVKRSVWHNGTIYKHTNTREHKAIDEMTKC